MSFKAAVSLLIFCLEGLFINVNEESISSFKSIKICFKYLGVPVLGAHVLSPYILFLD